MLLVLDNCEHLLDAAADFASDVLRRCPRLRILATSREPLGVDGEQVVVVRSLRVDSEAVELFIDRAHNADASFRADRSLIEQICQRLGGIPLAIELAAARVRTLRLPELASRLDAHLDVLTVGRHGRVERHKTLREHWTGAGDCSTTTNERHSGGSPSSPAASTWLPPTQSPPGRLSLTMRSTSCRRWSTSPWSSQTCVTKPPSACWSRSDNTVPNSWQQRARRRNLPAATPAITSSFAAASPTSCGGPTSSRSRPASPTPATTYAPRSYSPWRPRTSIWRWASLPLSAGTRASTCGRSHGLGAAVALGLPGADVHPLRAPTLSHASRGAWQLGDHTSALALADEALSLVDRGSTTWCDAQIGRETR